MAGNEKKCPHGVACGHSGGQSSVMGHTGSGGCTSSSTCFWARGRGAFRFQGVVGGWCGNTGSGNCTRSVHKNERESQRRSARAP